MARNGAVDGLIYRRARPRLRKLFLESFAVAAGQWGGVMLRSHGAHLRRGPHQSAPHRFAQSPRCWGEVQASSTAYRGPAENVCLSGKTGSDRRRVKTTLLTHSGHGRFVLAGLTYRWNLSDAAPQNSFGPGRSCFEVQVIRVAAATMSAIPAMLMITCMAIVLENWDRITNPINDNKTPRQ